MANQNSETQRVRSSFTKGMYQDSIYSLQPSQTYREAWNAVLQTSEAEGFGVANEGATELCAKIPEGYKVRGHHFLEERNWHILFLSNGGSSEIGYINTDDCTYNKVIDDSDVDGCNLDFGDNEWIPIESKTMQPCNEVHLYWSNDLTYKRLNIDNVPDDLSCETIKLFQCNCIPRLEVETVDKGGSNLEAGAYMYAAELEDEDGNTTNVFEVSPSVYIGSENNRAGDLSNHAVRIKVEDLPPNYSKVNLYSISVIGGSRTAKLLTTQFYNTDGIEYYHRSKDEFIKPVDLAEILVKDNQYIRGQDLIQYANRLFLYNVNGEINLDYQRRALNIKPSYYVGRVPLKYAHKFRGLRGDEVVSTAIWFNFCDGTRTRAYHIHNALATEGQGPFNEPTNDCDLPPWIYGNNAIRTGLNATDAESQQGSIDRAISRTTDEYRRFQPEEVEAITDDDYAVPNISELIDAVRGGGDDGNDCDCEVICQNLPGNWPDWPRPQEFTGLSRNNNYYQEIIARIEVAKAKCECDCLGTGGVIGPRSLEDSEYGSYNDTDVDRILLEAELTKKIEDGTLTGADVREFLDQYYAYDPSGPGLSGEYTDNTVSATPTPNLDCDGNDGGEVPPQLEDNHRDPVPEPLDGDDVEGRTITPPTTEDPEDGCDDGVTFDGTIPSEGYGNNPSITPPDNNGEGSNNVFDNHRNNRNGTTSGEYSSQGISAVNDCEPEIVYAEDGCTVVDIIPCTYAEGIPSYWESEETYPLTKDCDGEYIYGELAGEPIRHIKMPSRDIEPHFVSYQDGVPNVNNMDNEEYQDGFAHFLWLKFDDIELPSEDELPKPLCPKNPYTIGIAPRSDINKSVVSSGLTINTFKGQISGEEFLYPRHAVNSVEKVDRYIENGGRVPAQRIGSPNEDIPAYVYHSPDMTFNRPNQNQITVANFELDLYGTGYRHGLYAEGYDDSNFFRGVEHRKGARQAIHLNRFRTDRGRRQYLKGVDYVPHDKVLDKSDKFSRSLINKARESCVFFEAEEQYNVVRHQTPYSLSGLADGSFIGDVNTHEREINGAATYTTFKQYRPRQYGSLVNATYVPLHLATRQEAESGTVKTMDGDSFINLYSVKRTSYISDHVGDNLNPPMEFGGGLGSIKIIGNLLKNMFDNLGAERCGTVPKSGSGDIDPRANNQENGLSERAIPGSDRPNTRSTYYPTTAVTLVTFPVESDVNLGYRGSGDSPSTSTYRDLNGLNLDSSFANGEGDYERSWLDRYYSELSENSRFKILARVLINFFFTYGVGIYLIILSFLEILRISGDLILGVAFSNPVTVVIALLMALAVGVLGFLWIKVWANTDLDNRFIDNFLGIEFCYPDRTNNAIHWMRDSRVRGLEDNYIEYNYDFSYVNTVSANFGLPDPYNTCPCLGDTVNTVLYSNPQIPDSIIDSYRNFKTNNYREIPAHHGPLTKMFRFGGKLFVQTTDMIFDLRANRQSIDVQDDIETLSLSSPSIILQPIALFDGPAEGRGGNKDPNALKVTPFGVIFIDREARDVLLFNGRNVQSILPQGMDDWIKEHLFFESVKENPSLQYTDEKTNSSVWYNIGYDPRYERLLISKVDRLGDCDTSFTISYYPKKQAWASFHSYIPRFFTNDRYDMYSFNDEGMWRHNSDKKFQIFYGDFYPFEVEIVTTDTKHYNSFMWNYSVIDSECYEYNPEIDDYIRNPKVSFDSLILHNSYQNSGMHSFFDKDSETPMDKIRDRNFEVPLEFIHRRFRYNNVQDHLYDYMEPQFVKDCAVKPKALNQNNILDEPRLQKNKFYDNYLVNRLIFSKFSDKQLILKFIDSVIENRSE